ncbi:hemagglutinin repeat-containing protein [Pseudomonadota bacterium]
METELNGETILVPKVYLSNTTKLAINNRRDIEETRMGNIAAENNITIDTEEEMLNEGGSIIANSILTLEADHIRNTASISTTAAGGNIISRLNSKGLMKANTINFTASEFTNEGSDLTATNNLNITADTVDIKTAVVVNQTISQSDDSYSITRTEENISSNINAGSLVITSTGDTNITGSNITTTGNANITTGGDLNIKSAQDTYYHHAETSDDGGMFGGDSSSSVTVNRSTNVQSNINVGGDLTTNSDDNLNILASKVEADGNITLQADKNINILSGQNTYSRSEEANKDGIMYSNSSTGINETVTQVKSDIDAGNNLTINSGANTTLIASDITAETGDTTVVAGRYTDGGGTTHIDDTATVTVMNAMDSTYSYSEDKEERRDMGAMAVAGLFGPAGGYVGLQARKGNTDTVGKYDETVVGSNIEGQNISIQSGKDITIVSSKVDAETNAELLAGKMRNQAIPTQIDTINTEGKLTIASAQERHDHYEHHEDQQTDYVALTTTAALSNQLIGVGGIGVYMGAETARNSGEVVNERDKLETNTTQINQIASDVEAATLDALSADNITIIASNITTTGDTNLTSDNGEVNILTANEVTSTYRNEEHANFDEVDTTFNRGRVSIDLNAEITEQENQSNSLTAKSSNINTGGNLNITSQDDITVAGSNITSEQQINLTTTGANSDINITSAQNNQTTQEIYKDIQATVSVGVGNAYVDAGYAVDDTVKAAEAVKDAKSDLDRMKDLRDEGRATDEAVRDAEINLAMAVANFGLAELQAAAAMANTAGTCPTSLCTGFYGDTRLDVSTTASRTDTQAISNTSSNLLAANNVTFTTNDDMTQSGSNVTSTEGNINYNIGDDLTIEASKDTYNSQFGTDTTNASMVLGSSNLASIAVDSISGSLGYSQADQKTSSKTYNNSTTTAENGTININTGDDATVSGADLLAENVVMDIGGDLTVESRQNELHSKGSSSGLNIGMSGGTGTNGGNAGVNSGSFGLNYSENKTDRLWTDDQTTIVGTNSVDIDVADNTHIKGAVIANQTETTDANGNTVITDHGNLALNTRTLTYEDLHDSETSESKGFNFQASGWGTGGTTDSTNQANQQGTTGNNNSTRQQNQFPTGSTTIGMQDTGSEKEQITRATIGQGAITIDGVNSDDDPTLVAELNRDVNKAQEIIKDQITGALDFETTVDNRILTGFMEVEAIDENGDPVYEKNDDGTVKLDENGQPIKVMTSGWKQIGEEQRNMGGNLAKATVGATSTLTNPLVTVYEVATDKNIRITETISQWKANQKAGANMLILNKDVINNLSTGEFDVNEIQAATNNEEVKIYYNDKEKKSLHGKHDNDTNDIYLNAATGAATNTNTFVTTYGHETGHDYTNGYKESTSEAIANNSGSYASAIYGLSNLLTGSSVNTRGTATSKSWLASQKNNNNAMSTLINNTISANNVKNESDFVCGGVCILAASVAITAALAVKGDGDAIEGAKELANDISETKAGQIIGDTTEYVGENIINGADVVLNKTRITEEGERVVGDTLKKAGEWYVENVPEEIRDILWFSGIVGGTAATASAVTSGVKGLVGKSVGGSADEVAQNTISGGSYSQVRKANVGGEVHHMPANSVSEISTNNGPSIWMKTRDHKITASWGRLPEAKTYRQTQQNLISQGNYRDALLMDIQDIRGNFGTKYNESMLQNMEYIKTLDEFKK